MIAVERVSSRFGVEAEGPEELNMPLYMVQFAYTSDAWAALVDTQEDRSVAIASVAATMGSRMVSYYLTFGEYDGFTLIEAPDEVTAAAIVMVAVKTGHLKATKTTTVLSVEDGMAAMRKARQATFRGPGQSEESGPT